MPRPIYLKQLELGPMQNFIYLVGDPQTREAIVVDPGWEVPAILEAAQRDGYRIVGVALTHTHFDHVMGLGELLKSADVPVYLNRAEAHAAEVSASNLRPVEAGQVLKVGTVPVTMIHTPGHTPGSQCLLIDDHLLSGDTLFIGACGRCDLPGGDPSALYASLSTTLKQLPDHTRLFPGHNYSDEPSSTMGDEKQHNPFLQIPTPEQFLQMVGAGPRSR